MSVTSLDAGDSPDPSPAITTPRRPRDAAVACQLDSETFGCPCGGEILVVRVRGEVDLLTRPALTVALLEALSQGPRHLVIDLAGTTFCCARAYEELGRTAFVAGARGIDFALSGLSIHQDRIINLIMPEPGPARHRSVAAAVTTIRVGHEAPTVPASI